jgi:predicted ArsR family transcriptional regulator
MTRNAAIRELLADAPSTTHEISALLGISQRSAHVGMWVLAHQGHAAKTGRVIAHEGLGRPRNLYELTPKGRAMLRGALGG